MTSAAEARAASLPPRQSCKPGHTVSPAEEIKHKRSAPSALHELSVCQSHSPASSTTSIKMCTKFAKQS